jgi:hypothetical protein
MQRACGASRYQPVCGVCVWGADRGHLSYLCAVSVCGVCVRCLCVMSLCGVSVRCLCALCAVSMCLCTVSVDGLCARCLCVPRVHKDLDCVR